MSLPSSSHVRGGDDGRCSTVAFPRIRRNQRQHQHIQRCFPHEPELYLYSSVSNIGTPSFHGRLDETVEHGYKPCLEPAVWERTTKEQVSRLFLPAVWSWITGNDNSSRPQQSMRDNSCPGKDREGSFVNLFVLFSCTDQILGADHPSRSRQRMSSTPF